MYFKRIMSNYYYEGYIPDFFLNNSYIIVFFCFCSVLTSEPHPSCCCFSPHKASLVFAGAVSDQHAC